MKRCKGYLTRAKSLSALGFSSYPEYLKSDLWAEIRKAVLERDEFRCVCGKDATQVHHRSYGVAVMKGKRLNKLISLCGTCHERFEFKNDQKVSLSTANLRLKAQNLVTNFGYTLRDESQMANGKIRQYLKAMGCEYKDNPSRAEGFRRIAEKIRETA